MIDIVFALAVCAHFEQAVTDHFESAATGDQYAKRTITLHQYACQAAMKQSYGSIGSWECVVHTEPGASAFCIFTTRGRHDD